jgi:hypothetical protein
MDKDMLTRTMKTFFNTSYAAFKKPAFFQVKPALYRRFFTELSGQRRFPAVTPYVAGVVLSRQFITENKAKIDVAKKTLQAHLCCDRSADLDVFVNTLFDFEKSAALIAKIDSVASQVVSLQFPTLFQEYKQLFETSDDNALHVFLKNTFLPALRSVFKTLAGHYGFDSHLIETSNGVILDDDYMDFVRQGVLVLDLGEDGHGPLPHMMAAFMMKELELERGIQSALNLYKSLSLRSASYYCPSLMNYVYYFYLLLDYPATSGTHMFGNPSSMSNHLLMQGDVLKEFTSICKMHSGALCRFASDDWQNSNDKNYITVGRVLTL